MIEPDQLRELMLNPELRARMGAGASAHTGIEVLETSAERVRMRLPYSDALSRDSISGSLHTGAIVTAIDSAMGFAVMLHMESPEAIATLELRYDEIHVPAAGADVIVEARCQGIEEQVAYLTGDVWAADELVGHATARFIMTGAVEGLTLLAHLEQRSATRP